jgi:hypothetical protein
MAVTPETLRSQFPEFADPLVYTDIAINQWVTIAVSLLNAFRWGDTLDYGTTLFACHHLAMARRDQLSAAVGGIPGAPQGILTAKAVDKVSASYDSASISLEDSGMFAATSYGLQFLQLARWFGAGGVQIGVGPRNPQFWGGLGGGFLGGGGWGGIC